MKVIRKLIRQEGPTKIFRNYCGECNAELNRMKGEAVRCPSCNTILDWDWEGRNAIRK